MNLPEFLTARANDLVQEHIAQHIGLMPDPDPGHAGRFTGRCTIHPWEATGQHSTVMTAAHDHILAEHNTGKLAVGVLELVARHRSAHQTAERLQTSVMAEPSAAQARAFERALKAVAGPHHEHPDYNRDWILRGA